MMAIELVRPGTRDPDPDATRRIAQLCHQQGVVVLTCGSYGNVIRLLPPLVIDPGVAGRRTGGAGRSGGPGAHRAGTLIRGAQHPGLSEQRSLRAQRSAIRGQNGGGRGQPGVEALDLVLCVADQGAHPLPVGITG